MRCAFVGVMAIAIALVPRVAGAQAPREVLAIADGRWVPEGESRFESDRGPRISARMSPRHATRVSVAGSPSRTIPTAALPSSPMPTCAA
jgi:hypothetical protein